MLSLTEPGTLLLGYVLSIENQNTASHEVIRNNL